MPMAHACKFAERVVHSLVVRNPALLKFLPRAALDDDAGSNYLAGLALVLVEAHLAHDLVHHLAFNIGTKESSCHQQY